MSRIVVISGHPDLEQSYTNKVILNSLAERFTEVDIRRLDRLYPDYQIDVETEQQALLKADVIVLQFPFYWYSVPALMKKWIDDTFSFNFAYGPEGNKLKGKDFILSFTIGGPEEAYTPTGYNHFRIEELMKPLEQTAYLAGMNYRAPIYTHSMVYIPGVYNKQDVVEQRAAEHAERLAAQIEQVLDADESQITKFVKKWFEQFDLLPEDDSFFIKQLSDQVHMSMPEGEFHGHAGFRDWYSQVRQVFKPNCDHDVQQVEISALEGADNQYAVNLRVRLQAEALDDGAVDLTVNEDWVVSLGSEAQVTIHEYKVIVV